MTVEQLIAVLQKMPQDAEVWMNIITDGVEYIKYITSIKNCGEAVLLRHKRKEADNESQA